MKTCERDLGKKAGRKVGGATWDVSWRQGRNLAFPSDFRRPYQRPLRAPRPLPGEMMADVFQPEQPVVVRRSSRKRSGGPATPSPPSITPPTRRCALVFERVSEILASTNCVSSPPVRRWTQLAPHAPRTSEHFQSYVHLTAHRMLWWHKPMKDHELLWNTSL